MRILLLLLALFFLLFILGNIYSSSITPNKNISYGVSFSQRYAEYLGLEWKTVYLNILEGLEVKNLRISTVWNDIEKEKGQFSFEETDFLLDQAERNSAKILLVLGLKQPRWPECQPPIWVKNSTLQERKEATLQFIETVVKKYNDHPAVWGWQIENEPLLNFGKDCDPPDREFLKKEVRFIKKLDSSRPIVITDSGELRPWITPMRLSDIFGSTLYRQVYDRFFGYFYYPLPPVFYSIKSNIVKTLFAQNNQRTIISELQTEPWFKLSALETPVKDHPKIFSAADFAKTTEFAGRTGFDLIYLWGVEWWYFMDKFDNPEYLEFAKKLLKP